MKKLITKKDFILLIIVLIVGVAGFFLVNGSEQGTMAEIKLDGERVARIALNGEYLEKEVNGVTICRENGEIFVKESDCADKVCVRSGRISKTGEGIICAPNRVSVEINGESLLDAITG